MGSLKVQQSFLNTVKKKLGIVVANKKFGLVAMIYVLVICRGCKPFTNENVVDKNSVNVVIWRCSSQF